MSNKKKEVASIRVRVYPSTYRRIKVNTAKGGFSVMADYLELATNGKNESGKAKR